MNNNPKTYQDWCIDTLLFIYQNRDNYNFTEKDKGYRYAINALLTNHASMYYRPSDKAQKTYINLWWDHLNQSTLPFFFQPLLMSSAAAKYLEERTYVTESGKLDKDAMKQRLHFEHITPNGVIIDEIERSRKVPPPERDFICSVLKYHKLVLLTKEERDRYMDGAKDIEDHCTTFQQKDIALLEQWDKSIPPMAKEGDKCKALGNGPLRLAHLVNCGIQFVLRGKPLDTSSFSEFEQYFSEPYAFSM